MGVTQACGGPGDRAWKNKSSSSIVGSPLKYRKPKSQEAATCQRIWHGKRGQSCRTLTFLRVFTTLFSQNKTFKDNSTSKINSISTLSKISEKFLVRFIWDLFLLFWIDSLPLLLFLKGKLINVFLCSLNFLVNFQSLILTHLNFLGI